jgi:ribosomal protein S8
VKEHKHFTDLQKFKLAVKYLAMIKNPEEYKYMDRYRDSRQIELKLKPV